MKREQQLDFLIKQLSPLADLPGTAEAKWQLLRSLMNVREPQPVSNDFLSVQDALLQSLIAEKGITDIDDLQPIQDGIYLWRGDITTLKVDAIVNAANDALLGCFIPCHSCIDNAIHSYAGVQLRLECAEIMEKQGKPESTGQAKITSAYNLPSRYILHTVGPIINNQVHDCDRELLASSYRSCLELAEQNKLESIAFCCISTGVFHSPNDEAAAIAVKTVRDFLKINGQRMKVIFNVFTEQDERIYKALLE